MNMAMAIGAVLVALLLAAAILSHRSGASDEVPYGRLVWIGRVT